MADTPPEPTGKFPHAEFIRVTDSQRNIAVLWSKENGITKAAAYRHFLNRGMKLTPDGMNFDPNVVILRIPKDDPEKLRAAVTAIREIERDLMARIENAEKESE
ncbi:hypothetical protein E1265_21315 [Streptomyces sp. 8K308]|uniref:hypothetical protein n=1 Tax=Streptomyces sp. 8K308 TaxID=2530388 RepID=UPI00105374F8|nr:hypothetical protein [Streptomyces sp. 8K308]TDC20612.1 hypothetical protein E1265_21315 [Streptomyces sp. 8K308]